MSDEVNAMCQVWTFGYDRKLRSSSSKVSGIGSNAWTVAFVRRDVAASDQVPRFAPTSTTTFGFAAATCARSHDSPLVS